MSTTRVVVVGSINRDIIIRTPTLPKPGETVLGTSLESRLGGKGANQAAAAARAGAAVTMIGSVGVDGADLLAELRSAGVDVDGVHSLAGTPSGTAAVTVSADGENAIVVVAGANALLTRETLTARTSALDGPDGVLVLQGEIPLEVVEHAARQAQERGWRIVLNLAPFIPLAPDVVAAADPLVVNELEAAALLTWNGSSAAAPESAATILARNARSVVITVGARGAIVCTGQDVRSVLAPPVAVVDTTGAGDAFVGTLAAALSRGVALHEAVREAVDAGSHAVTYHGAQPPKERSL